MMFLKKKTTTSSSFRKLSLKTKAIPMGKFKPLAINTNVAFPIKNNSLLREASHNAFLSQGSKRSLFSKGFCSPALPDSPKVSVKAKALKGIISPEEKKAIEEYQYRRSTPISLESMVQRGKSKQKEEALLRTKWLKNEIPVRLAHMIGQLEKLPFGLGKQREIQLVTDLYRQSFSKFYNFPKISSHNIEKFSQVVSEVRNSHNDVQLDIAAGIQNLQEIWNNEDRGALPNLAPWLDAFYTNRISIRVMLAQHMALLEKPQRGFVGNIELACCPGSIVKDAADTVSRMCHDYYGDAPKVEFKGEFETTFTYIPGHIYYILFELLKNSFRAVVETHGVDKPLPPIEVIIANGVQDISLKISDQGGGIHRNDLDNVWTYAYTTAKHVDAESDLPKMAGYGYGLPLSKLYARYFGGDLDLMSLDGYGTDCFLFLPKLDQVEALPPFKQSYH